MPILSIMIQFIISLAGHALVRRSFGALFLMFCLVASATPAFANSQAPASGGGVLNILFLILIAYFLVRMFRRRSGGRQDSRNDQWKQERPEDDQQGRVVRPMDRHEAARQAWSHLSSDTEQEAVRPTTPSSGEVNAFNESEFLEGAKLFFSRFQQAGDKRDFDELRGFMSDGVYADAVAQAERNPVGGQSEIMLLNAKLMEVKNENGHTLATVFYDAQIRRGVSGDSAEHIRAVWEFSRDDNGSGGLWTLEKINKVDQ